LEVLKLLLVILVLQWIVYRLDIEVVALLMCRNKRPEFTAWLLEVKKVTLSIRSKVLYDAN